MKSSFSYYKDMENVGNFLNRGGYASLNAIPTQS